MAVEEGEREAASSAESVRSELAVEGGASAASVAPQATVEPQPVKAPVVAAKADPNQFVVTLASKDSSHPYFGVGDKHGFAVDGQGGRELVLQRGQTYTFKVQSTPLHDFYLSTDPTGWGGGVIEEGVTGNFTYSGSVTFSPGPNTPDVVYYQCQNHKAMGSRIFIVDAGAKVDLAKLRAEHGPLAPQSEGQSFQAVSEQEVKQKISYAGMVAMSKPAQRVAASNNAAAKALLDEGKSMLQNARAKLEAHENGAAMGLVDEALRKIGAASQMVPSEDLQAEQRQRFEEVRRAVGQIRSNHQKAFERTVAEKGKAAGVKYDVAKVDGLVAEGEKLAKAGRYQEAVKSVQEAERLVTVAVNKMLESQTVVYKLNVDTPEGEFQYEVDRYQGYVELVDVALAESTPGEAQRELFDKFIAKGNEMYKQAHQFASESNYPDAIRMVQDATNQMRSGLRLLGVNQ